jgi:hypothetical protein
MSATDRERRRQGANLKRRLALLKHHARLRSLAGSEKSPQAVRGGMAAWRAKVRAVGGDARILGLEMALRRWHPEKDATDGRT